MPVFQDFSLIRYEDGALLVIMTPPVPIGGWTIRFRMTKRFGNQSGIIPDKYVASGFNGVSGLTVINSGTGQFQVQINSVDTSGLDPGNYATESRRLDSGLQVAISEGYLLLGP